MKYKNNIFHKFYFHKFHLQVVFQGATVGICQNFKILVLKFFSQYYTTKKMGAPKIWWCHQIYPPPLPSPPPSYPLSWLLIQIFMCSKGRVFLIVWFLREMVLVLYFINLPNFIVWLPLLLAILGTMCN